MFATNPTTTSTQTCAFVPEICLGTFNPIWLCVPRRIAADYCSTVNENKLSIKIIIACQENAANQRQHRLEHVFSNKFECIVPQTWRCILRSVALEQFSAQQMFDQLQFLLKTCILFANNAATGKICELNARLGCLVDDSQTTPESPIGVWTRQRTNKTLESHDCIHGTDHHVLSTKYISAGAHRAFLIPPLFFSNFSNLPQFVVRLLLWLIPARCWSSRSWKSKTSRTLSPSLGARTMPTRRMCSLLLS